MAAVKIIATPPGEAPQEIREAWVGLVLPIIAQSAQTRLLCGVLTGPKNYFATLIWWLLRKGERQTGYQVNVETAVSLLAQANPAAAQWWRENTPHMFAPGRSFLFSAEVCEEVEEVVWPPPPNHQSM